MKSQVGTQQYIGKIYLEAKSRPRYIIENGTEEIEIGKGKDER